MTEHEANQALLSSAEEAARLLNIIKARTRLNPSKRAETPDQMLDRATMIRRTLGVRNAAAYMRSRGFTLQGALWHLLRTSERWPLGA